MLDVWDFLKFRFIVYLSYDIKSLDLVDVIFELATV